MILFRLIFSLGYSMMVLSCYSQCYKNLVFEGAGVRGIAYAGALAELENRNILSQIENVGGTSAGAIAAMCVALGYSSKDIQRITDETKLQRFNDGSFLFLGGFARLNRNYGWYRGDVMIKWLEKIIVEKTQNADITFAELHAQGFRDLYVTGTSLNHQRLILFSWETYPNMKIKDAVRISMSIPLYFEAVSIDSVGNVLGKKNRTEDMDIMVDGGVTGNFPIFIFDSVAVVNGSHVRISNPLTLGLRIDTPQQIQYDVQQKGLAPIAIHSFRNYVGAFYGYVIENLNREALTTADWERTISISSAHIGPKIRKLSTDEKDLLMGTGRVATQRFLNKFCNTDYDNKGSNNSF
jgi:NTE family protein